MFLKEFVEFNEHEIKYEHDDKKNYKYYKIIDISIVTFFLNTQILTMI